MNSRRDIRRSVFNRNTRSEKLILSELLTDTDSRAVVEFSGHRGRIEDDRPEIQRLLTKRVLGEAAIRWEDAETDTPSVEYDRYDTW